MWVWGHSACGGSGASGLSYDAGLTELDGAKLEDIGKKCGCMMRQRGIKQTDVRIVFMGVQEKMKVRKHDIEVN